MPTPEAVLAGLDELRKLMGDFDRVSVGFPGVDQARHHLDRRQPASRHGSAFPLQAELEKRWKKPVRVCNDAAVQGYGAIQGKGVEMVLTLGTGMGSSLFTDGHLCPGLELGHHPWRKKGMTYEDYLGRRGLDKYGKTRWNDFLEAASSRPQQPSTGTTSTSAAATPRRSFSAPAHVSIVSNETGLFGGVALWRFDG